MNVTYAGAGISNWDLRVFADDGDGDGKFTLHGESIREFVPCIASIKRPVSRDFVLLIERDETDKVPSDASRGAYFVFPRC